MSVGVYACLDVGTYRRLPATRRVRRATRFQLYERGIRQATVPFPHVCRRC